MDVDSECTFDGNALLVFDNKRTRIPLPDPDEQGYRQVFICCCDCGLVHVFSIASDHMYAVRADMDEADKIRAAALAQDPTKFPLCRGKSAR